MKTFLDIPWAMLGFASREGAIQDRISKQWYVVGEVPVSLLSFVPKEIRRPIREPAPVCSKCRSHMVKRYNKRDGDRFWGCSKYPVCKNTVEWDYGITELDEDHDQVSTTSTFSEVVIDDEKIVALKAKLESIIKTVFEKLGNGSARKWLITPKIALQGKTPTQVMDSIEGCEKVEMLLSSLDD